MNVWRMGYSQLEVELAAAWDGEPGVYICKLKGVDDSAFIILYPVAGWQPWQYPGYVGKAEDVPHFPWGWPAVSDRPP